MENEKIAKVAVEAFREFIVLTKREPIIGASIRFLERTIVDRIKSTSKKDI